MKKEIKTLGIAALIIIQAGCNYMNDLKEEINTAGSPLVVFTPADGAEHIYPDTDIVLQFSEPMKSDGWIVTVDGTDYTTGTWSGNTLTINPEDYEWSASVSVQLNMFFSAVDGSAFTSPLFFSFTVRDPLPTVKIFTPADGTSGIGVNSDITITFSEPMNTAGGWGVTAAGVTYSAATPSLISWGSSANGDNTLLVINPAALFIRGNVIDVNLTGFSAALDAAPLQTPDDFWFRAETDPDVTASISPGGAAAVDIPVDTDIVISFSEEMKTSNGWSVSIDGVTYSSATPSLAVWSGSGNGTNTVLTINPSGTFARPSNVAVSLNGFNAEYDNAALTGDTGTTFTVRGMPVVNSFSPINGQTDVSGYTKIIINFSERMDGSGWMATVGPAGNQKVYNEYTPGVSWTDNGRVLEIAEPSDPYTRKTYIYVSLVNFKSPADNQALTGTNSISFIITELNMPQLTGMTYDPHPLNASTATVNSNIVLNFSEYINMSNNWSVTVVETDSGKSITYDILSNNALWSGGGLTLTINPAANFLRGDTVTVYLNGFRAALDNAPLKSAPAEYFAVNNVKPAVTSYSPGDGEADVRDDRQIVLTFSEEMSVTGWNVAVSKSISGYKSISTGTWSTDRKTLTIDPDLAVNDSVNVDLTGFTAAVDNWDLTGTTAISFHVWHRLRVKIMLYDITATEINYDAWCDVASNIDLSWNFESAKIGDLYDSLGWLPSPGIDDFERNDTVLARGYGGYLGFEKTYESIERTAGDKINIRFTKMIDNDDGTCSDKYFASGEVMTIQYDVNLNQLKGFINFNSDYNIKTMVDGYNDWWYLPNDNVMYNYLVRFGGEDSEGTLFATFKISVEPY